MRASLTAALGDSLPFGDEPAKVSVLAGEIVHQLLLSPCSHLGAL